jgi:hypothetical protein
MTGFPRGPDGGTLTEAELEIAVLGQECGAVRHNWNIGSRISIYETLKSIFGYKFTPSLRILANMPTLSKIR